MSVETVSVERRRYRVNVDGPELTARRLWAIAAGRVIDELTGAAPAAPLTVSAREPALLVRVLADGVFCLVARPWDRFPPLRAAAYPLHLDVTAPGYLPATLSFDVPTHQRHIAAPAPAAGVTQLTLDDASGIAAGQWLLLGPDDDRREYTRVVAVGPGPNQVTLSAPLKAAHPLAAVVAVDGYRTLPLGEVALHRETVALRGRAFRRDDQTNSVLPVAGATLAVTDFWRSLPDLQAMQPGAMTDPNPANRSFLLSASPGLHADRASGATVAAQALPSVAGDDKWLLESSVVGTDTLRLSDRHHLVVGDVLLIDPDQGDAAEAMTVTAIDSDGGDSEPARVTLSLPLRCPHGSGARVQRLAPAATAAPRSLRHAAQPGDRCLLVDDLGGLAASGWVQVAGGAPDDRQRAAEIRAVSDADGYFRLPPLHRVAALEFNGTAPALAPVTVHFQPDYSLRENWLDVVFT